LDDLGCAAGTPPGSVDEVAASTHHRDIVWKFRDLRTEDPNGTDHPMLNVGRPDIYSLHGQVGYRACTWHDRHERVCWFLGFVRQHDYGEFEERAAAGELLPSDEDYAALYVEQENLDFARRVAPGVRKLIKQASTDGGRSRGTVGSLLRLDVAVEMVAVGDDEVADAHILVRLPHPDTGRPPDWPGPSLLPALAEAALGRCPDDTEVVYSPPMVPGESGLRPLDHASEMCVLIRSVPLHELVDGQDVTDE
jgi:hypothetical protein